MAYNKQPFQKDRIFGNNYKGGHEPSDDSDINLDNYNDGSNVSEDASNDDKIYTKQNQPKVSAMNKYNVSNPDCNIQFKLRF